MTQISVFDSETKIRIYCEEIYQPQSEWVLNTLKKIFENKQELFDGVKIKFGWTIFTLQCYNNEFVVAEPDFLLNPFKDLSVDITTSLAVLAGQKDFIKKIGNEPEEISFQDKIVVAKGCLFEPKIYLERNNSSKEDDSGWFIGYEENTNNRNERLEAIYVYELLKYRPSLLNVLNLPSKFLVVFNNDKIQAVLNENDEEVYSDID